DEVEELGLEVAGGADRGVDRGERPVGGGEALLQADAGDPAVGAVGAGCGGRGGGRRHGGHGRAGSDQLPGPVSARLIGPVDLLLAVDWRGGRRRAIEAALRSAIRSGRLAPGTPLPSTRALAAELGVARGTVVDAYDQLVAEGFLAARRGGRTIVAAGVNR